nr:hypothetical protein [uncultured Prevotella sp.]
MEKELNIAEILKDKPQGTKLYSSACGKCTLEEADDKSFKISFYNSKFGFMNGGEGYLDKNGKLYDEGECVVFPSKEMRDWSKFAWKKGDVLVSKDNVHIIFEKFEDDAYTKFRGKYYLWEESYNEEVFQMETSVFEKATDDAAQTYINTIEERLGGKLNCETLEIEKTHPEFKDGDIVCISGMGYLAYGIVKSIDNSSKKLEYYALNDMSTLKTDDWLSFEDKQIQPITETQQIILFDALAKEGKAWDAEKKQIVDLKPKCEFKPFDRCIWKIRNCEGSIWRASFVSYVDEYGAIPMGVSIDEDLVNLIILPYKDQTKLLVGTTDEWEGGEQ